MLQIINKQKDISDSKFAEIIGPISEIISNIIYVALTSFKNQSIIENVQDETERYKKLHEQKYNEFYKDTRIEDDNKLRELMVRLANL